ncbi:MAG: hypothetical protein KAJ07_05930 [Planctomycetes bacterium]|nr:hypothetical protein [Planctomycetota bacterium]
MDAQEIQNDIIRKMTPEKKLQMSMRLYYSARNLKAAWLRHLHSDWSEEQVQKAVTDIFAHARS